ncbi:MAG: hypothetical protein KGL54_02935 [Sphingomonadales bacterium]|nr:hypothetical protein [Sphingomonadales bacterium]
MHRSATKAINGLARGARHEMVFSAMVFAIQLVATTFFLVDGVSEQLQQPSGLLSLDFAMEGFTAFAMLGGVFLSLLYMARLKRDLRWKDQTLSQAKGALGDHVVQRFREWGLTASEGEVALFALKGFDIGEIARLRQVAAGTIRSQLSQVYAKAGVTSQAKLVSLFIDDLLDASLLTAQPASPIPSQLPGAR